MEDSLPPGAQPGAAADAAAPEEEKRVDPSDGGSYTLGSFKEVYGDRAGLHLWAEAGRIMMRDHPEARGALTGPGSLALSAAWDARTARCMNRRTMAALQRLAFARAVHDMIGQLDPLALESFLADALGAPQAVADRHAAECARRMVRSGRDGWLALQEMSQRLRSNITVVLAAARRNHRALKCVHPRLWTDRDFMLSAVSLCGDVLGLPGQDGVQIGVQIGGELDDRQVVLTAVKQCGQAVRFASGRLQTDRQVVLSALGQCSGIFAVIVKSLQLLPEWENLIVYKRPGSVLAANSVFALWADREVMLAAAERDSHREYRGGFGALQCIAIAACCEADDVLREDAIGWRCTMLLDVGRHRFTLSNTELVLDWSDPTSLLADREVVLAAVSKCGVALQFAAPELQADRAVVLEAVGSCGEAIHYASAELQRDPDVQLAAVVQSGRLTTLLPMEAERQVSTLEQYFKYGEYSYDEDDYDEDDYNYDGETRKRSRRFHAASLVAQRDEATPAIRTLSAVYLNAAWCGVLVDSGTFEDGEDLLFAQKRISSRRQRLIECRIPAMTPAAFAGLCAEMAATETLWNNGINPLGLMEGAGYRWLRKGNGWAWLHSDNNGCAAAAAAGAAAGGDGGSGGRLPETEESQPAAEAPRLLPGDDTQGLLSLQLKPLALYDAARAHRAAMIDERRDWDSRSLDRSRGPRYDTVEKLCSLANAGVASRRHDQAMVEAMRVSRIFASELGESTYSDWGFRGFGGLGDDSDEYHGYEQAADKHDDRGTRGRLSGGGKQRRR